MLTRATILTTYMDGRALSSPGRTLRRDPGATLVLQIGSHGLVSRRWCWWASVVLVSSSVGGHVGVRRRLILVDIFPVVLVVARRLDFHDAIAELEEEALAEVSKRLPHRLQNGTTLAGADHTTNNLLPTDEGRISQNSTYEEKRRHTKGD